MRVIGIVQEGIVGGPAAVVHLRVLLREAGRGASLKLDRSHHVLKPVNTANDNILREYTVNNALV